jgi:lipid-A-disaccharide synthase
LTWLFGRRLVKLDTFAMPNLIAGKKVVPELIQSDFTGKAVMRELKKILPDGEPRRQMQEELAQVKRKLAVTEAPAVRAAAEILKGIN